MKIASGSDSVDCFDASLVRRLTQDDLNLIQVDPNQTLIRLMKYSTWTYKSVVQQDQIPQPESRL